MSNSTEDILGKWRKQVEEDNKNRTEEQTYGNVEDFNYSDQELEEYKKTVDSYKAESDAMQNQYNRFHEMYKKITEEELNEKECTKLENVNVCVKHVYCPVCGKELVSSVPVIFNPYTMEKIAKYDCSCGFKANLEYAYPRVVYTDKDGNEIKAFNM